MCEPFDISQVSREVAGTKMLRKSEDETHLGDSKSWIRLKYPLN
jgi:hypothetical protein